MVEKFWDAAKIGGGLEEASYGNHFRTLDLKDAADARLSHKPNTRP